MLKRAGQLFADRANALAPRGGGTPHLAGSYGVATTLNKRNHKEAKRAGRADVYMYAGTADPAGVHARIRQHSPSGRSRMRVRLLTKRGCRLLRLIEADMSEDIRKTTERARRKAERAARKTS